METELSNEISTQIKQTIPNDQTTFEQLKMLRDKIEKLPNEQHNEILKLLLKDQQLNFTENKSGTFVNLSDASLVTLKALTEYINHLEHQEETLSNIQENQDKCEVYLAN